MNRPFPGLEKQLIKVVATTADVPSKALLSKLQSAWLADPTLVDAWNIAPDDLASVVAVRSHQLKTLYPQLLQFCRRTLGMETCPLAIAWNLWLPLAAEIAQLHQTAQRPIIQGILGIQGTGKTTLAAVLRLILSAWGYRVCQLSLDDLYRTYSDRRQLQQIDPRMQWRGPPGTHDLDLGLKVLQQLRSGDAQPIMIPRFDKSLWDGAGDRTSPEPVSEIDIVLFEGWFVGVRPIDPTTFETAPPPIETEADREFARAMNEQLQRYLPLWDQLDRLVVLYPKDYRLSQQWRWQAEQQMIATGRSGMSADEVQEFVEYFWRSLHPELFLPPLIQDGDRTHLVVEIQADHTPGKIYRP